MATSTFPGGPARTPLLSPLLLLLIVRAGGGRGVGEGWANSSVGVHVFLTEDGGISNDSIAANPHAAALDFVWGASGSKIAAYRRANPSTVRCDPAAAQAIPRVLPRVARAC